MTILVSSLTIYPLKGATGVPLRKMDLDARGPRGDRRWMLIDAHSEFVSLRDVPQLCFIAVEPVDHGLRLTARGAGSIDVAFPSGDAEMITVRIWGRQGRVRVADPSASRWLSSVVGVMCRLVYLPDDARGPDGAAYGPFQGAPRAVALSDGAPLLLTNDESLSDLNARLAVPVPMYRFRPNVVVTGLEAWAEDRWRSFTIGQVPFEAGEPCARCAATTVDYAEGVRGPEPLRTLATFRRVGNAVHFGTNVAHQSTGSIQVGDEVRECP